MTGRRAPGPAGSPSWRTVRPPTSTVLSSGEAVPPSRRSTLPGRGAAAADDVSRETQAVSAASEAPFPEWTSPPPIPSEPAGAVGPRRSVAGSNRVPCGSTGTSMASSGARLVRLLPTSRPPSVSPRPSPGGDQPIPVSATSALASPASAAADTRLHGSADRSPLAAGSSGVSRPASASPAPRRRRAASTGSSVMASTAADVAVRLTSRQLIQPITGSESVTSTVSVRPGSGTCPGEASSPEAGRRRGTDSRGITRAPLPGRRVRPPAAAPPRPAGEGDPARPLPRGAMRGRPPSVPSASFGELMARSSLRPPPRPWPDLVGCPRLLTSPGPSCPLASAGRGRATSAVLLVSSTEPDRPGPVHPAEGHPRESPTAGRRRGDPPAAARASGPIDGGQPSPRPPPRPVSPSLSPASVGRSEVPRASGVPRETAGRSSSSRRAGSEAASWSGSVATRAVTIDSPALAHRSGPLDGGAGPPAASWYLSSGRAMVAITGARTAAPPPTTIASIAEAA